MKILFVLEYFPPHIGGAETVFEQLTKELAQKSHKVTVLTTRLPGTKRREEKNGVEILRVKTPPFARRYWFTLLGIPLAVKLAKKHDLVHTTTYNAAFPAWLAAKIAKRKIVIHVLEVFGKQWFNLGEKNIIFSASFFLYEKLLFFLPFDSYIAISNFTKNNLIEFFNIPNEKIMIVYPEIDKKLWNPNRYKREDFRKKLGVKKEEFVYLFFGRPGISKGVEYLVKAVPSIKKKIPKSKLILILSKDPRNRYEMVKKMTSSLGLEKEVVLIPSVARDELPGYIKAADCIVIPSLSEGFGLSALEASNMGVPIVATNVGALQEVIFGKYLLVEPKDVASLTEAIFAVVRGKLTTTKRKIGETQKPALKYLEIYERVKKEKIRVNKKELNRLRAKILLSAKEESLPSGMEGIFHITSDLVWHRFVTYLIFLARNLPKDGVVLDAGCGLGQNASGLKILRPDLEVLGVDICRTRVWKELKIFGCRLEKGNVLSLKFRNDTFDAIMSFGVMEHLNDEKPLGDSGKDLIFLKELYRVLKPGGKLFIFHLPNKLSWSEKMAELLGLWYHQQKYSEREIKILFKKTKFVDVKVSSHDLIPGQLGRVNKTLELLANSLAPFLTILDRALLKTPLSIFSQNFSIKAQKQLW